MSKYSLPSFLNGIVNEKDYVKWLYLKADHIRRDRKRGNTIATRESYKQAIHKAVQASDGVDAYTREKLHWHRIIDNKSSRYNNELSRKGRRKYKAGFGLQPTVDHVGNGLGKPRFKICAWRTNDAKSDLSLSEFVALCRKVVAANPHIARMR